MSYDIDLCHPITGEVLELEHPHEMHGGTYVLGGTTVMSLNITYNYSEYYYNHIDSELGIRWIYGKTGAETIPVLKKACESLADDVHDDYWEPTEGNAKQALLQLIALAELRPDGVWQGD